MSRPIEPAQAAAPTDHETSDASVPPRAGPFLSSGTPEAVIARALLSLEDSEQRSESLRAESLRQRLEQRRAAIDDRRREARLNLVAGIASGVAEIAKGACELVSAGGSSNEPGDAVDGVDASATELGAAAEAAADAARLTRTNWGLRAAQWASDLTANIAGFHAKQAGLDGESHDVQAEAFEASADRAERARDDADQSADRMLDGMRELGRIRHEAALAALRG
jgi:hypothetical protein